MPRFGSSIRISATMLLVVFTVITTGCTETRSQPSWNFEGTTDGDLPDGWVVEATNQKGDPAQWKVIQDATAPSGEMVLALVSPPKKVGSNFNICWTESVIFQDGELEVDFKALKGRIDQGGGLMWRVKDKDNYYIARFNPLEDNFRIYYVHDGSRRKIGDAHIALPAGKWHTMKIIQKGNKFEGYINGKKLVEGTNDLFSEAGGIGLWTKADAVTSFDDLEVKPLQP